MSYFSKNRFSLRQVVLLLAIVFVMFISIPYAIGKLVVNPIGNTPIYTGGPIFALGSLPVVNVTVPNEFTSGTTISSSQVNANFSAIANQMPGVDWADISKYEVNVRTSVATIDTVTISAPCAGYVVVRFDGVASADTGDYITLAASDATSYSGTNFTYFIGDGHGHPFSHTRVYAVSAGNNTFYALANNPSHTGSGSGLINVFGTLTATFYPNKY